MLRMIYSPVQNTPLFPLKHVVLVCNVASSIKFVYIKKQLRKASSAMANLYANMDAVHATQEAKAAFIHQANSGSGPAAVWQLQQKQAVHMYPSGAFNANTSGGPMSSLQAGGPKQNKLQGKGTENLQRTQTQNVLRANLTRLVLPISMPEAFGQPGNRHIYRTFVSGDVMFSLRLTQQMVAHGEATPVTRHNHPQQVFTLNLQTVNYLLLNLQECLFHDPADGDASYKKWENYLYQIMHEDFTHGQLERKFQDIYDKLHPGRVPKWEKYTFLKRFVWRFVKNYVRITGVYIGSEQQGGQHQGAANPCSHNPTDYVGTVQTMGKYEKTRNVWTTSKRGVGNGDLLGFTLRYLEGGDGETRRISLSGNPSTPQHANLVSAKAAIGRFVLVPAVYEAMVLSRNEDLDRVLRFYRDDINPSMSEGDFYTIMHEASPGISVSGGYFMQFGVVNEMSKGVTGSRDAVTYALDATACTMVMNCEVLLRFTVGEPPKKRAKTLQTASANPGGGKVPVVPILEPAGRMANTHRNRSRAIGRARDPEDGMSRMSSVPDEVHEEEI